MKGKKKLAKIIVSCVLAVAIIVGGVVFVRQKTDNKFEAVIMDVGTSKITQTLSTQGVVESTNREEFEIFDGVVVKEVFVKLGDRVEKGQLLATFEPSSLNGILSQKQSDYDNAKLNYLNSISSAKEASAKLPLIEAQIAELEAEVKKYEQSESKDETPDTSENIPDWVNNIDYEKLTKLLGKNYTEEKLRNYFIKLANRGAERQSIFDFISSLNSGSSFDFESMLGSSEDMEAMSAQMNLMTLKAQKTMLETQSQNVLESTYKSLMDSAELKLNSTKSAVTKLAKGWYAQGDGVVSTLSVFPGQAFVSQQNSSQLDLSALMGMMSGGTDVSSLLSSFGSSAQKQVGLTVEYYDSFIASFSLGKYDVLDVKVGQKAVITSLGNELEGEVIYISPVASQSSGIDINSMINAMGGASSGSSNSIPAQVLIKNPNESVIIGIDVDIDIELGVVDNAVVVPIEAVETDDTGSYVYKFDENNSTVSRVAVELGLATDTQYQVISGCSVGDKIVQNQAIALKEIAEEGKKVAVTYATDEAV